MRKRARLLLQDAARITGAVAVVPDPLGSTLPEAPTVPQQIAAAKAELLGTDTPDGAGLPTDLAGLKSLIRTMLGQQQMPSGNWPMSHYRLATRVAALETVQAAQQAVLDALGKGYDQQSATVQVLTANLQLAQQRAQALETKQAAYDLRLAANDAKDTLTANATEANRLDIVALKAADVLLQTRATNDEAAIAAAQTTATQARTVADAAQKKADQDADAVLLVQAQAKAAQDTADAAKQAQAAFAARFRSVRVTLPAIPLLGLDVVVTFSAFADPNFTAIGEPAGLALLGLDATELPTARTSSTATFRIKPLSVAIQAGGVLNFLALHD
jgi:hypothetical protein